jgi:hypothetical protein
MDDEPTCGKGLAEHATLPAKIGELIGALAGVLEFHQTALDLTDANARKEHDAYVALAKGHRDIAARLATITREMTGYRDLPMGRHDFQALASPEAIDAFDKFVALEQEVRDLLQEAVERDQKMLEDMRHART